MEIKQPIKSSDYHKAVLMVLNLVLDLKLSQMELDMVSCMLKHNMQTIDIYSRETIRMELDKDKYSVNNYMSRLREKGMLITKPYDKNLYVNPKIIEAVKDKKMVLEIESVD